MIVKEKTSESGHWYTKDGSPAYTTVGANGNERATTLRDARKLGLLPSVTTINGLLSKGGLDTWKQQQVLLAALTLPRLDGEPEHDWLARVMQDSKETGRKAAERGEAIHAIIQTFYENVYMPELPPYVKIVEAAINEHFGPRLWLSERSFAHPDGYGGKCDLMSRSDYASHWDGAVVDFKTKDTPLDKAEVYDLDKVRMEMEAAMPDASAEAADPTAGMEGAAAAPGGETAAPAADAPLKALQDSMANEKK